MKKISSLFVVRFRSGGGSEILRRLLREATVSQERYDVTRRRRSRSFLQKETPNAFARHGGQAEQAKEAKIDA